MEYLNFLEDEDREKLQLLMTLQQYNEQFLTQKKLIEETGLSKFLLDKYITELNHSCPTLNISEELYDEMSYQPVSNDLVQKMQYVYAQRSLKFRFLVEVLIEEKSVKKFQEDHHIAKTTLYQIRSRVLSSLKNEQITVKKNKLIGYEMKIRSVIFDIIAYFYFGEDSPFGSENNKNASHLLKQLTTYFHLDLSFLQQKKLLLFIQVLQIRVKNRHMLSENFCTVSENMQNTYKTQLLSIEQVLHGTIEYDFEELRECNYLMLFLYVSEMFDAQLTFNQDLFIQNEKTAQQLVALLQTNFQLSELQRKQLHEAFLKKLLAFSIFRQSYTTFIDTAAYQYFAEVHFLLHKIILRFVRTDSFILSLDLSKSDQAKLYYDMVFSVLAILDPCQLGKPINIYIDFSHGTAYTEFIGQSLRRFRDLNISIQKKFNNETNIFLSDYRLQEANCTQIIWKQPPTPSDWSKFADLVIQLREIENEKSQSF